MGRFLQGGNFAFFVSRLKKLCWTAVAKPKPIFSTVLSSACLVKYTTTPPNLHQFTALHCAVLRANIALQKYLYSAVQCSELVQDCWWANEVWPQKSSIFFKWHKKGKNSHSGEPYPYGLFTPNRSIVGLALTQTNSAFTFISCIVASGIWTGFGWGGPQNVEHE